MKKLVFLSDLHLSFCKKPTINSLIEKLSQFDGVIVAGDIADGNCLKFYLNYLAKIQKPIYYIHGNHDFYASTFDQTRDISREACANSQYLFWLQESPIIELTKDSCIIGCDGWWDCGYGNYYDSIGFKLNDFYSNRVLKQLNRDQSSVFFSKPYFSKTCST